MGIQPNPVANKPRAMVQATSRGPIILGFLLVSGWLLSAKAYYPDDCVVGDGSSYRGSTSTTRKGVTCQRWSSQSPNTHRQWTQDKRDNKGIGYHNYCRNPDGDSRPWCITTDPYKQWDYCDIPTCQTGQRTTPPTTKGCSCTDYVNRNGIGQCKKSARLQFDNKVSCYVNLPTTCTDKIPSTTDRDKWLSHEACQSTGGSRSSVWGSWGSWGSCSCREGTQRRTRRCSGANCAGDNQEQRQCNPGPRCGCGERKTRRNVTTLTSGEEIRLQTALHLAISSITPWENYQDVANFH